MLRRRVLELYDYDRMTGLFVRRCPAGKRWQVGSIAGGDVNGYVGIRVNGKRYQAHHLAWLIVHGSMPKEIDHINRNKRDNRISNLRLATPTQNLANTGLSKRNTSGARGVSWIKEKKKYRARLRVDGRFIHLGYFKEVEVAAKIVLDFRVSHYGEFAR